MTEYTGLDLEMATDGHYHEAMWLIAANCSVLQLDYGHITHPFPPGRIVMDGLFQSIGLRALGFYTIVIDTIISALQIYFLIVMYISVIHILLSIRSDNLYEERSLE